MFDDYEKLDMDQIAFKLGPCVHEFEKLILRPVYVGFLATVLICGMCAHFWWAVASMVACWLIGLIGAGLHPRQTAAQLAGGPLSGPAARRESASLTDEEQRLLVDKACTYVGLLIGISLVAVLLFAFAWHFYVAIPLGWIVTLTFGAILKLRFKTLR